MSDLKPPPPPPRRSISPSRTPPSSGTTTPNGTPSSGGWKDKLKSKSTAFGKVALVKGTALSDKVGARVNDIAEKRFGSEAFWPTTGDLPKEMDKCARILRAFTVEGVVKEEPDPTDPSHKKKQKVLRKIPAKVIAECKGLAIFTSFRSGIAPLGGAGGAGVVVARLEDGSWSAPSSISPNNLSTGLLLGVDIYDCVLVIRSQKALDSFGTHKVTLGTEIAVAAGPYGAGAAVEAGKEQAPVFSYVRSRGLYAGVELVGQVFLERYEENGNMYHWPGVKARDIVRIPVEAASLHAALRDAETGRAQTMHGDPADVVLPEGAEALHLEEGQVLHLPPTPDQTDGHEQESDPETERVRRSSDLTRGFPPGAPPPLPPRARPEMSKLHSSNSHYSEDEHGGDLPPAYEDHGAHAPILSEKEDKPGYMDDGRPYPDEKAQTMSAGEGHEWEQYYAEQAGGSAASAPVGAGAGTGQQASMESGLTPGLEESHLENPFGDSKASDSLR